jgi:hypothetical protein
VSERKELGKIDSVSVGLYCGRSDSLLGVSFSFKGPDFGTSTQLVLCTASEWDFDREEDGEDPNPVSVDRVMSKEVLELIRIMRAAKVRDVTKLQGIPVEVTFLHGALKSWRVLTEVL